MSNGQSYNFIGIKQNYSITYGWVAEINKVQNNYRENVQEASSSDFEQIVSMIYGDEDIGKSYNKKGLAKQLFQRSKDDNSRNYVIKKNNQVIAHACTNAEINRISSTNCGNKNIFMNINATADKTHNFKRHKKLS